MPLKTGFSRDKSVEKAGKVRKYIKITDIRKSANL